MNTNLKDVMTAAEMEAPDFVPVVLFGTTRFFARQAGYKVRELYHDPSKRLEAVENSFDKFSEIFFLPGLRTDYGTVTQLLGLGAIPKWEKDYVPSIKGERMKSAEDVNDLEFPKMETEGIMPFVLESIEYFEENTDLELNFPACLPGPLEKAFLLIGSRFLNDLRKDEENSEKLLDMMFELTAKWLKKQLEKMDEEPKGVLITDDVVGFISPQLYKKHDLKERYRKLFQEFDQYIRVFHSDQKMKQHYENFPWEELEIFNFPPTDDIKNIKEKLGEKVCLWGGLTPQEDLISGSLNHIEEKAKKLIKHGAPNGGFMLGTSGGIGAETPAKNIRKIVEIVEQHGKYPIDF